MGTVTKTIGTASRDYSTLQAWEDALPANLVTDGNAQVGECYNDSEFTAKLTISGQTTNSTNNITLRCASGQSFKDHADKLTNRLAYNQSNGVGIRTTAGYDGGAIVVGTNNVTLEGLQLKATGTGTYAISSSGSPSGFVVSKCICSAVSQSNVNAYVVSIYGASSNKITNSLVISDSSNANSGIFLGSGANAINCTLVRPSNRTAGGKAFTSVYGSSIVRNCAIFGFTTSSSGTYASDGHNVTDHTSAPGSTGNVTSATYANQFVQSSTGSSVEDFRIVGTGADLDDAGTTDTTNIPGGDDIVGQTRSTWDVGCWEYVSGSNTGTGSTTLDNLTLSATASITAQGQASIALAGVTLSATGSITNRGAATPTLADVTLSATGASVNQGEASITLADATLSATGSIANRGAATPTLADVTLSAAGSITAQGAANITLADLSLAATGESTPVGSGTASITLDDVSVAATGSLVSRGQATVTLEDLSLLASGSVTNRGEADITLADLSLSATGGEAVSTLDLILKILSNRQELDPTSGLFTIYDDDGSTVLYTAAAWEDAAGTIPYRGQALRRIDRLSI